MIFGYTWGGRNSCKISRFARGGEGQLYRLGNVGKNKGRMACSLAMVTEPSHLHLVKNARGPKDCKADDFNVYPVLLNFSPWALKASFRPITRMLGIVLFHILFRGHPFEYNNLEFRIICIVRLYFVVCMLIGLAMVSFCVLVCYILLILYSQFYDLY